MYGLPRSYRSEFKLSYESLNSNSRTRVWCGSPHTGLRRHARRARIAWLGEGGGWGVARPRAQGAARALCGSLCKMRISCKFVCVSLHVTHIRYPGPLLRGWGGLGGGRQSVYCLRPGVLRGPVPGRRSQRETEDSDRRPVPSGRSRRAGGPDGHGFLSGHGVPVTAYRSRRTGHGVLVTVWR